MADNDKDHQSNGELDRFTKLMFRGSKQRDSLDVIENDSRDKVEQRKHSISDTKTFGIDDWFLGKRERAPEKKTQSTLNQIEDTLKNVDLDLLLETMDMLIKTSKQYKPIIKEFSPLFNRFFKKFKSHTNE